jgi:hypothetical protein
MKTRKREIAKVGIFGSKDNPQIVNEKDLKEIAETFAEIKKAPVSLNGHWPDPSSPRLGNVVGVSYDDKTQTLTGDIEEKVILAKYVDEGFFPDVSIGSRQRASDGKMYLHHLAYLGEEPPAIKDLVKEIKTDLGIAAGDTAGCRILPSPSEKRFYLSDVPPETQNFENKNGSADPSLSSEKVSQVRREGDSQNQVKEVCTMTDEEAQKLREENERLKKENDAKELALSDAEKQKKEADRNRLKAEMDSKGVPQGIREKALRLCDAMDNGKTIELSDSEAPEGKRRVSAADCLIEIITAFPKPVETGVMNLSDGNDTAGIAAASAENSKRIKFNNI